MSRNKNLVGRSLCKAVLALAISAILPVTNAVAQTSESVSAFDIPAGKLSDALDSFMTQSGAQILYKTDLIAGKKSQALRGSMDRAVALTQLLAGTGLVWEKANGSTFVIKRTETAPTKPRKTQEKVGSTPVSDAENEPTTMDTMVVTGTRIRGGTTASPVITIGADQIREEGFADLGEVVRSISQNFSGGQNPGVTVGAGLSGESNNNVTGGSALNLRGLGPDATLTLLNGRRLAYDGVYQGVDIGAIPIEAVERIEIVPDGASAIYGSDAVAGVANVVLKRDFDGAVIGARYGTSADGGLTTRDYTATIGTTWTTGGVIATWKKSSSDPIFSNQRDYTENLPTPNTLYPGADLVSGLVSAHQSLGDIAELRLDALKTDREQIQYFGYSDFYYQYFQKTSVSLISPSLEIALPHDWSLKFGGTSGKDESINKQQYVDPTTSAVYVNCYCNQNQSYEIGAEGPLFSLSGGEARLAVGLGSRTDKYRFSSTTLFGGEEGARYAYAELNLPLVAPESTISGLHRLEFSAAIRGEDYDSFGRVSTPKFGLIYEPSSDFTIKASWGKSFKAPTLTQRYLVKVAYLWNASAVGGNGFDPDATALMSYGGNADLQPERSRSWSTSLGFHPETMPSLEAELTWFDIDYTDRVVQPINMISEALSNPNNAEYVDYSVTPEEQAELISSYNDSFYNFSDFVYDPVDVVAIVSAQYVNAARQRVQGIDLSGSYWFDFGPGRLTIRGSSSWLKSSQKTSESQSEFDLAGTTFNPAKFKGRIGAVWTQGGLSASGFVNYTDGVTSNLVGLAEKGASFTTIDATLHYDTGLRSDAFSGIDFALSAQNLLNRAPPFYTATADNYPPYDSTNYSAIGRYLSISISKRW